MIFSLAGASAANSQSRTVALLARMTLEEKIGQMALFQASAITNKSDIKNCFLGAVICDAGLETTESPNSGTKAVEVFQSWAFRTRLKIPLLCATDTLNRPSRTHGAVIFPQNIGLSAMDNAALVQQATRTIGHETAATGIRWKLSDCLGIPQRQGKGLSEISARAFSFASASVKGLQGNTLSEPTSVLACANFDTELNPHENVLDEPGLRRLYLPSLTAAIRTGAGSMMLSTRTEGKTQLNQYLWTRLLKNELGFKGFLVSRCNGTQFSADYKNALETQINAGADMILVPGGCSCQEFIQLLKELVAEQRVSTARIDDAVSRILRAKFDLGLFEDPFVDQRLLASVGSQEHRQIARECVRESLVLLRNDKGFLPLSKNLRRLHVAGKAAADLHTQCGRITSETSSGGSSITGTTLLEGIRKSVATSTQVTYSHDASSLSGADAALIVISQDQGSANAISQEDQALIRKVKLSGVRFATIVLSQGPLSLGDALKSSDALVAAWLPGTEGQGVADVLFGVHPFTGKLPCDWPAAIGTNQREASEPPLFRCGFGLGYGSPDLAEAPNVRRIESTLDAPDGAN